VETGEISGSDVTIIETVTVCTIDRRQGSNQKPQCTIKRVRILSNPVSKSDAEPSEASASPTSDNEAAPSESAGAMTEQMCPISSREKTPEEQEAEMVDCMIKSHEKEKDEKDTVAGRIERNPGLPRWKPNKRKRDTS
jgi:hypothetical protein